MHAGSLCVYASSYHAGLWTLVSPSASLPKTREPSRQRVGSLAIFLVPGILSDTVGTD